MRIRAFGWVVVLAVVWTAPAVPAAKELTLSSVLFPERRTVDLSFLASANAPQAKIGAKVTYRDAQARVEVAFADMKPAVLFAGDVTAYVLWAITRDGQTENLGELIVREPKGVLEYSTALKSFALLVTAEAYYLVNRPSELVMFYNAPSKDKKAPSSDFTFAGLAEAPKHALSSIANIRWDSSTPIDLLQAEKAHELATRRGAERYASPAYQEATAALDQAHKMSNKDKKMLDYARRAIALSNVAINITHHTMEAERLAESVARRRAEMEGLEARAAAAETAAREARTASEQARAEQETARRELREMREAKQQLQSETNALRQEKAAAEAAMVDLRAEKARLERTTATLQKEKATLSDRLQDALSRVAETQESARGFVVNLPDILFDVNEATLKPDAKVVIAKLAGILLLMPDLRLQVEGHTDSTGSASYNRQLSERRAASVVTFLTEQGVEAKRMSSVGLGMDRPIASNDTPDGRRKNRRVEIVISDRTAKS